MASSFPGVEAAAAVSNSPGNVAQCEQQQTLVKAHSCIHQLHLTAFQCPYSASGLYQPNLQPTHLHQRGPEACQSCL